jgi:hypothetical protein
MKPLFCDKTFFLQSSKVGTFSEIGKKSCVGAKNREKSFHFKVICSYFCPLKLLVFDNNSSLTKL